MKKTYFIGFLGGIFSLTSCQQSEELVSGNESYPVVIKASIVGSEMIAGRYVGDTPNDVSFKSEDQIGVALKDGDGFVKWSYDGSNWKQTGNSMTWKNKVDNHTFYAFYPFTEKATLTNVPMPNLDEQLGTMTSVATYDFLVADKTLMYTTEGGKVSFTEDDAFEHVSSLVVLTLNHVGDLASATINNISLKGTNIVSQSNYTFGAETPVSLEEDGQDDEISVNFTDVTMTDNRTFYLVVNSGTVDLSAVTLEINYTDVNQNKCKASCTGLNKNTDDKFESGKLYNYGITITSGVLTVSGGEIGDWKDGISLDITINGEKQ